MAFQRTVCFPADVLPLKEADPEIYELIQEERQRQRDSIDLIASEVCGLHMA